MNTPRTLHPNASSLYSFDDLAKLSHLKLSRLKRWSRLYGFPAADPRGLFSAQDLKYLLDVKLKLGEGLKPKQAIAQTLGHLPYYTDSIEQAVKLGYVSKAQLLLSEAVSVLSLDDIGKLMHHMLGRPTPAQGTV